MKKLHEVLWEEIDGSIFTAEEFEVKLESGKRVMTRLSVAFNVGRETARHIVEAHNHYYWNYMS